MACMLWLAAFAPVIRRLWCSLGRTTVQARVGFSQFVVCHQTGHTHERAWVAAAGRGLECIDMLHSNASLDFVCK